MGSYKRCPHCKHINLERAVFCFQCGWPLAQRPASRDQASAARPAARRSQRIVETMWATEEDHHRPISGVTGTALLSQLQLEEPLTCLSCGALNRPTARYCTSCGVELLIPHGQSGLQARVSGRTDVGQHRDNNEDSIGLWSVHGALLALVADGMGGAVAGEEASRLTVEAVQADFVGEERGGAALLSLAEELIMDKLAGAIQSANLAVIDRVDKDARLRGMGTTATLAFVYGRRAMVAHVGDSRAYLIDGEQGWINQITSDHSFVEALLAAGHITADQVAQHPMRNVLYRALGQTPDTTADVYDRYLKAGDRIVLCSDGLTRHVTPRELADIALEEARPENATQRLIDLANERGGEDNISIVVICMEDTIDVTAELAALTDEEIRRRRDETGLLSSDDVEEPGHSDSPSDMISHLEMLRSLGFAGDEDPGDPAVADRGEQ